MYLYNRIPCDSASNKTTTSQNNLEEYQKHDIV